MKIGLVMEGGAMRGMFTAGVLDVLMENKITFDGAVGVSAGAIFGCNLKSGQKGRAIRYNIRFSKEKRYCSLWSLMHTGDLYGVKFCYDEIPNRLDKMNYKAYRENPMAFYVVCTNVNTGKAVYPKLKDIEGEGMRWLRASASLPMVSRPVKIGDGAYLDGGLSDSIPLKFMQDKGYEKNLVILTRPDSYQKKPDRLTEHTARKMKDYPNLARTIRERYLMYNEQTEYVREQEALGSTFVIRPEEKLPVKNIEHNPKKLRQAYNIGRKSMEDHLDELLAFMQE